MSCIRIKTNTLILLSLVILTFGCSNLTEEDTSNLLSDSSSLLTFVLPVGSEVYLNANSVYAEIDGVDVAIAVCTKEFADQAIDEFREGFEKQTMRAGFSITGFKEQEMLGESSTVIDYDKPAWQIADNGDDRVRVREYTRQAYINFGSESLMLTVWSKGGDTKVIAVCESILRRAEHGETRRIDSALLVLRTSGQSLESFSELPADNVLDSQLQISLEHR